MLAGRIEVEEEGVVLGVVEVGVLLERRDRAPDERQRRNAAPLRSRAVEPHPPAAVALRGPAPHALDLGAVGHRSGRVWRRRRRRPSERLHLPDRAQDRDRRREQQREEEQRDRGALGEVAAADALEERVARQAPASRSPVRRGSGCSTTVMSVNVRTAPNSVATAITGRVSGHRDLPQLSPEAGTVDVRRVVDVVRDRDEPGHDDHRRQRHDPPDVHGDHRRHREGVAPSQYRLLSINPSERSTQSIGL